MDQNKILEWVKKYKTKTAIILFFSLIVLIALSYLTINIYQRLSYKYYPEKIVGGYDYPMTSSPASYDSFLMERDIVSNETLNELEIKEGRINTKSENAENDFEILKNIVDQKNGYIENSSKTEGNTILRINATARIPIQDFDDFIDEVKKTFEVEDFSLMNYRVDIQREVDELSIVKQAIEDYNLLRKETLEMKASKERIELLSMITNEMQYLARQQRELERSLGSREKQSDLTTINFTFSENLKAKIWPENLINRFRDRINWAIDSVLTTLMFLIANVLVLFVKIIEYIIYIIVIAIPIIFAWKLIKKLKHLVK